jgi:transmembrane 9 superfamily member 2/4
MQGVLLAGLVPFAVLFIELMFVFKSLWLDKSGYYYVFGFLSVVSTILIITVSEVTIIATYIQLCSEVSNQRPCK